MGVKDPGKLSRVGKEGRNSHLELKGENKEQKKTHERGWERREIKLKKLPAN